MLEAIFLVNEKCVLRYDVYNVASNDYITVNEIARLAIEVSNLTPASVKLCHTGGDRGWKGDVPIVRFDCSKIQAMGWRCSRTSSEALSNALTAMLHEIDIM